MTGQRCGPPEREEPGPTPGTGPIRKSARASEAANHDHDTATVRQCGAGPGLRRRRAASYRCEPLTSGHRDPWQPWRPERCSSKQVDGAVDAAEYLRDIGYPALFDLPMLRSLWRAGHHRLVDELRGDRR